MSVPRVTLTKVEAAEALGMSIDTLERYVLDDVRVIRRGRLVLIPVAELQRWADKSAALTLDREKDPRAVERGRKGAAARARNQAARPLPD